MHRPLVMGSLLASTLACGRPPDAHDEVGDASSDASSTAASESATGSETGSASEGDSESGVPDCVEQQQPLGPVVASPRTMMLVVDTSRSMATLHDHDADPGTPALSRSEVARMIVEQILAEFGDHDHLGLQRHPAANACPGGVCSDADACLLAAAPELAPAAGTAPAILAALPSETAELRGGSPASAAIASASELLLAGDLESPGLIVWISDGQANCSEGLALPAAFESYDPTLADAITSSANQGVPVVVVGVDVPPGSSSAPGDDLPAIADRFTTLGNLALAGGVPLALGQQPQKFFDIGHLGELLDALRPTEGLLDCTLDLQQTELGPPPIQQFRYVTLVRDGVKLPVYVHGCDEGDGEGLSWLVVGELLEFCELECDAWQGGQAYTLLYGCPGGSLTMPSVHD